MAYWRAITWPIAGLLFWWCAGRAIDALLAAWRSKMGPRICAVEVVGASLLAVLCLLGTIALLVDDKDVDLTTWILLSGLVLWLLLSTSVLAAKLTQWRAARIMKQA